MNQTLFSAKILPLVKIFLKLLTCTPYFASLFLLIVEAFIIRIQISRSVNFLLSAYIQSTGKKYADHAATLHIWAKRQSAEKKIEPRIPDYTFKEGESL